MTAPLAQQFRSFASDLKTLFLGHGQLLRQEMHTKFTTLWQQSSLAAGGVSMVLASCLLALIGLTFWLGHALAAWSGWDYLQATGTAACAMATVLALCSWLLLRHSSLRLKRAGFLPSETLGSLKASLQSLADPTLTPTTTPSAAMNVAPTPIQSSNSGPAVPKPNPPQPARTPDTPPWTTALTWLEMGLNPKYRAFAKRALSTLAAFPSRHPGITSALGLSAVYLFWQNSKRSQPQQIVANYVADKSEACQDFASDLHRTAARCGGDVSAAAEAVQQTYAQTHDSLSDGLESLTDAVRRLRRDASAGYRQARQFVQAEPGLALVGGAALALGAMLLMKSARR